MPPSTPHRLTRFQRDLLAFLDRQSMGRATEKELKEEFATTWPGLSRSLGVLETAGYLRRAEARARVEITTEGRRAFR